MGLTLFLIIIGFIFVLQSAIPFLLKTDNCVRCNDSRRAYRRPYNCFIQENICCNYFHYRPHLTDCLFYLGATIVT